MNKGMRLLWLAVKKFLQIDGFIWAAAFAYQAFFSLFPLIILAVTIAAVFVDRDSAGAMAIHYLEQFVPISGTMQDTIFNTIAGVIDARSQAGTLAFLLLLWVAIQCFSTLISVTNRTWQAEAYSWWRLPMRSLWIFGIMAVVVLVGVLLPLLAAMAKAWLLPFYELAAWAYGLITFFIPMLAVFFSLSVFYRFAPHRPTRFAEVWLGALFATGLMQISEVLFVIYLRDFATLNVVYGAFGGVMALLLWIYLSGCIYILGTCICVAQVEMRKRQHEIA